jgi:type IV pilus assembly protein PilQ
MMKFRWILGIFLILGLAAPGLGESPTGESLVQLRDVTVEPKEDGLTAQLRMTGQAKYEHALIDTPWRVVIDLKGTSYGWRKTPLTVGEDPVRQIRGSQYRKGITRVVLELSRKTAYRIDEGPDGLTVKFQAPTAAKTKPEPGKIESAKPKAPPKLAKAEAPKPAVKPDPEKAKPEPKPEEKALAKPVPLLTQAPLPTAAAPAPIRVAQAPSREPQAQAPSPANGKRLISFDFKDADIVNVFRILAAESGKNLVLGDDVKGKVSLTLNNVTWDLAMEIILEARGLEKIERDNVIRIVTRDLLTKDREAKARAEEAKLKAEAEVRTKIAEVQLKEQEVEQRKLAAEAARAEAEARGPLTEELIRLAYRDPEEVANTLIGILGGLPQAPSPAAAPVVPPAGPPFSALYGAGAQQPTQAPAVAPELLAKGITIRADKPTNSVFIRHYKADVERIKKLIREKLDIPLPQVKIEARLNEMSRTDLFEIGIRWGGAGAIQDRRNILVGQGTATQNPGGGVTPVSQTGKLFGNELRNPNVPLTGFLPVSPTTGLPLGGNVVNLPATGPLGAVAFGLIGTRINLNLILEALEEQKKSRSLSKPEIVTMENAKATISLGSEIPYATVSSAGTQIQFKEATLKLEVTPTVIREPGVTKIKMKVIVSDDSKGADVPSGTAGGFVPSINKRKAETEVIVKEGETLVIGGITQRQESETLRKVPLLGDIPILGWLFKARRSTVDPNRELVVFISPTVLPADQPPQSQTEKPQKP